MNKLHKMGWAALPVAMVLGIFSVGCGTEGAPQPPSLNLPDRVEDLTATRTGDHVSLSWTMPTKNTDKLLLKGNVAVHVCRAQGAGKCETAGADLLLAPGTAGTFAETLPPALSSGTPRTLSYFVELKNRNGRSAGPSNAATVLAGAAPAPISDLTAEVRKSGVVLRWTPDGAASEAVRLHRKLLTPPAAKAAKGPLAPRPEPIEENLLVNSGTREGRALDKSITFGQTYEYRAQRVARVTAGGRTLELAGDISAPVRIAAIDVFPPAVPAGLEAVATVEDSGTAAIDLSWQPDTETDVAGYAVYRREGDTAWRRISPAQPLVGPAFHDSEVQPGHTYRYAVSAIDQNGHESARSEEAQEAVPAP